MIAIVALLLAPLAAQASDAQQLIDLIRRRPATMDKATWREQRREAARELGRRHEREAVPTLLRIIKRERFDVILEIAIDSLGRIGDPRARPTLEALLNDPSVDTYVRDAASRALERIGKAHQTPPEAAPPKPTTTSKAPPPARRTARPTESTAKRADRPAPLAEGPVVWSGKLAATDGTLSEDILAMTSEVDFVLGNSQLRVDGAAARTTANGSLATRFFHQAERKQLGYTIEGHGALAFDVVDERNTDASWLLKPQLALRPELRFYPFDGGASPFFGQIIADVGLDSVIADDAVTEQRSSLAASLASSFAVGYGRVIDVGPRLRMQRMLRVLRRVGLLAGNVPRTVRREIWRRWYLLRDHIGSFQRLGHTLAVLRQQGYLRKYVDPAVAYRLIRILDDPQLLRRRAGLQLSTGVTLAQQLLKGAPDQTSTVLFLHGLYARQHRRRALAAELHFAYDTWGSPDTLQLDGKLSHRWYFYNAAEDGLGDFELALSAGLRRLRNVGDTFGYSALASVSFGRQLTRGSELRVGAEGGLQQHSGIFMLTLSGRYGIIAGSYVAR
ncbi:MAG: HEAT repeat domain-containing protein [Deltaproteobacteria bacterium]|nr:HEAT repeat domain-containing protein [Deltaproteobacteria bacterium]